MDRRIWKINTEGKDAICEIEEKIKVLVWQETYKEANIRIDLYSEMDRSLLSDMNIDYIKRRKEGDLLDSERQNESNEEKIIKA